MTAKKIYLLAWKRVGSDRGTYTRFPNLKSVNKFVKSSPLVDRRVQPTLIVR